MPILGLNTPQQRRDFLATHWQQSHCFFPAALADFQDPVSADDLAALAMEEHIESRIIEGSELQTSHGPFSAERLQNFPERNASLLVQSVDQYDSETAELIAAFDFIPAWRRDDVMVSFATEGGGVGPHFDHYDVFLIQGEGQRHWRIGQHCDENSDIDETSGHKVLRNFEQIAEYTLSPGDILYVPPGVAHWGTSLSNSLCYSIGFRAPSVAELSETWFEQLADSPAAQQRYQDDIAIPLAENGRAKEKISTASVQRMQQLFAELASNGNAVASALGILQTERSIGAEEDDEIAATFAQPYSWANIEAKLKRGCVLLKNARSRVCYYESDASHLLFVNGHRVQLTNCDTEWLDILCSAHSLSAEVVMQHCSAQNTANRKPLIQLLEHAAWYTEEDQP